MTDPRETAIAAGAEALRREGKHEQADLLDSVPSMVAALMARAERAEAGLTEVMLERDRWEQRACTADGVIDRDRARIAVLAAENARLRHLIREASDPDFILGAMDNVHDAETTLDDYAAAASRAIRAALGADE